MGPGVRAALAEGTAQQQRVEVWSAKGRARSCEALKPNGGSLALTLSHMGIHWQVLNRETMIRSLF